MNATYSSLQTQATGLTAETVEEKAKRRAAELEAELQVLNSEPDLGVKLQVGLTEINDKDEEIELDCVIMFHWNDEKLKSLTKPANIPGVKESKRRYERIANDDKDFEKPIISFFNSGEQNLILENLFLDRETGTVCYFLNYIVKVWIRADLRNFPYDRQYFTLVMGIRPICLSAYRIALYWLIQIIELYFYT